MSLLLKLNKVFLTLSVMTGVLLFSLNALAWPFGNDEDENKPRFSERKIGSLGVARVAHFQGLVSQRQIIEGDISILNRVLLEQESEWNSYGKTMKSEYGVTPDLLYTFSPTNLTVYLIITNGVKGATQETPILRAHRAFANREQATKFLKLVSSRNSSDNRVKVLRSLLEEKKTTLSKILNELSTVYYVDPGKNYRFDAKTGDLFEVTQLPSIAQVEAALKAKKKADEEKEKKAKAEKLAAEKAAKARREADRIKKEKEEKAKKLAAKAAREKKEEEEKAKKLAAKKAKEAAKEKKRLEKEAQKREKSLTKKEAKGK